MTINKVTKLCSELKDYLTNSQDEQTKGCRSIVTDKFVEKLSIMEDGRLTVAELLKLF